MAQKRLNGIPKAKVVSAINKRHDRPSLAAQCLRAAFGYVGPDAVWQEVNCIEPAAIEELKTVLRLHPAGR